MKKRVFGRQLKRDANERKALFKNLLTELVLRERIKTTEAKAKAIKAQADKLITKAKKSLPAGRQGEASRGVLHPLVSDKASDKLIKDIAPRFVKRNGGYTRIIKIGKRRVGDNAPVVYIEWSEKKAEAAEVKTKSAKTEKVKKTASKNKKQIKKEAQAKEKTKPAVVKKADEKVHKPGFLKQLVTRQKKG